MNSLVAFLFLALSASAQILNRPPKAAGPENCEPLECRTNTAAYNCVPFFKSVAVKAEDIVERRNFDLTIKKRFKTLVVVAVHKSGAPLAPSFVASKYNKRKFLNRCL